MFAKVFQQILDSSIADDPYLRHFFMDLLILADADGVVDMTPAAIAARTRLPLPDVERWLQALEQPDKFSRSPEAEGRRLVPVDSHRTWGWRIVNFRRYRESANREMLRMSETARKRAYRERHGPGSPLPHTPSQQKVEAEGESEQSRTCPGHVRDTRDWPALDEVLRFAVEQSIPEACARKWWQEHDARGGLDRHGQRIQRWPSALQAYGAAWKSVEARQAPRTTRPPVPTTRTSPDHTQGFL